MLARLFKSNWDYLAPEREDVSSTLGEDNSISMTPTTSTPTFTKFDTIIHSGAYQCWVEGLLNDLVSRTVDVLFASEW